MSDEYKTIQYTVDDRVATIMINRAERRNALNNQVIDELTSALDSARVDTDVNVIVLTGAGERAFSAGGDLSPSGGMGGGMLGMHWDRGGFADLLLGSAEHFDRPLQSINFLTGLDSSRNDEKRVLGAL